ncbi:FHA domain-containing serine/threonine-protein kinase [Lentzea sp. NPDC051213]|uniref:FHA domain-containing serine/threonine-protein kinase n=1 Tax=Lentzea sp. NPDC051213 TaxID=3364126 RepID=UPI0037B7D71B
MAWSVTLSSGQVEHVFTDRASCVIGRSSACDVQVPVEEKKVSRRHCVVEIRPPKVHVRDLGSRNGTRLNDIRLGPEHGDRELVHGDRLRVGDVVLRVAVYSDPDVVSPPGLEIARELGRGGQGVVHLARHSASGELVAFKTLTAQVDPAARTAFVREMECTRALVHPNIVRFHDSSVHNGQLGYSSEYCRGGSVAELGTLPVPRAVELTLQALEGLGHAHTAEIPVRLADGGQTVSRGLVHRDLKPQNLLLTAAGLLKIADFGLAKAFDQAGLSGHTFTGAVDGSLAFMPRRQLLDYKYARPDVDLWAITACLYWMLTGSAPRDFPPGVDPVAVVLRERPVPVRERLATVPESLAGVIDRVLDESSGAGPATAAELAGLLNQDRWCVS